MPSPIKYPFLGIPPGPQTDHVYVEAECPRETLLAMPSVVIIQPYSVPVSLPAASGTRRRLRADLGAATKRLEARKALSIVQDLQLPSQIVYVLEITLNELAP